jgi:octaprenyl-diphosphate synthase
MSRSSEHALAVDAISNLTGEDMLEVNQLIRQCLHSDVVLVNQIGEYIINSGGKRLRPILHLLAAKSCGYSGKQHIRLAAII